MTFIIMGNIEAMIEQEAASGASRRSLALSYAFAIQNMQHDRPPDWKRINAAILSNYNENTLRQVKSRAWALIKEKKRAALEQGAR